MVSSKVCASPRPDIYSLSPDGRPLRATHAEAAP